MDEALRRKLEIGKRALKFARAHPDSSPEYVAAVARLEALLARAAELEKEENNGRKPAEYGKVLPFRKRSSQDDPTQPAA